EHEPTGTSSILEQTVTHPLLIFFRSIAATGEIIAKSSHPTTTSLIVALGSNGVFDSHVMSNQGPMEQLKSADTMPNGYGTVRLPHLPWQPGSVLLMVAAAENGRRETHRNMTRIRKSRCIFVAGDYISRWSVS
nr:hypothetical protein [Tanacetum cinerariifolium]